VSVTVLLDADIVAYQLAATAQRTYKWPGLEQPAVAADDFATLPARIDAEVNSITRAVGADKLIVCLSCPTSENWRLGVLPTYKANRAATVRPVHLQAVKDYLESEYPSYRRPTLEADDVMGILSTHPRLVKGKKIIVSEDKDMKTVPGWLYNPRKDLKPWRVSEDEADWWHMYQTLVGDATDGYTGLPRCGPVKATQVLGDAEDGPGALWERVLSAYEAKGLTEEHALVQARVARICRATDYDFKTKKAIEWDPPQT